MKKVVVYGSHLWSECPKLKEFLSEKQVKFAYFDISEDLASLKRFLKIRDNNPVYDSVKKEGRIGLPTILIDDDEVIVGFERETLEKIF